ncbi:hypothetical protein HKBW3S03_01341 [Candidatus Hakubella thermalkaliphila]|uniref:Uncharacterized protein n=1 Tax=Candidatus Hakubella thermalkaliphila TaxID=2754717 RepID=A0A6V8NIF4_9ACTN|nr:hypothetical protein HKBW3S03_01341 [Candidatus Hakubella thermalkaliphila]
MTLLLENFYDTGWQKVSSECVVKARLFLFTMREER